jgi:hypothetical protein
MLKMPSSVRIEANKRRILLVPMIFDHTADDGLVLFGHSQPPFYGRTRRLVEETMAVKKCFNGALYLK